MTREELEKEFNEADAALDKISFVESYVYGGLDKWKAAWARYDAAKKRLKDNEEAKP